MSLSVVDLFCGSGGLSAGFLDAGFDVISAYDNWDAALKTYRRNLSEHAQKTDLSNIGESVEKVLSARPDIIAGGPPCQDFSTAGKRSEGRRANLTVAFGDIVSRCASPFFLMENVPQVRLSEAYNYTKNRLVMSGYEISEIILDASLCGVPQARKRFFAFGSLGSKAHTNFMQSIQSRISKHKMTVKEYMKDELNIEYYYRHPRNYSRRSVFSVYEPSPTVRGVNRPVPPNYKGNHLDSVPPSTVRPLTSRERSRIQTFPASWDWGKKDRNADIELQIGNAVPVTLASFVATGIRHATE